MVGMNMDSAHREALEQRRSTVAQDEGRLSRELEEGFMDDSDDEVNRGQLERARVPSMMRPCIPHNRRRRLYLHIGTLFINGSN